MNLTILSLIFFLFVIGHQSLQIYQNLVSKFLLVIRCKIISMGIRSHTMVFKFGTNPILALQVIHKIDNNHPIGIFVNSPSTFSDCAGVKGPKKRYRRHLLRFIFLLKHHCLPSLEVSLLSSNLDCMSPRVAILQLFSPNALLISLREPT